ncbi:hypothetical protein [Mesorhizobium sp.]|uniref:hypothetical protein n=1 Tax=Mesorhizobium sp. TaxID=1871066 RepID=UPI000FE575AC|nr:hypothetical protein [Mesorhizobium sp.]RWO57276.1 MAG: hypothetical protein EOS14_23735 [Mesorhizobium sp.]
MIVAAALVTAWAGLGRADDNELFSAMLGEAVALDELCPSLQIDQNMVVNYAGILNVGNSDKIKADMRAFYERSRIAWASKPFDDACAAGQRLYGAKGTKLPMLLKN